jgi:hypothetical protein
MGQYLRRHGIRYREWKRRTGGQRRQVFDEEVHVVYKLDV